MNECKIRVERDVIPSLLDANLLKESGMSVKVNFGFRWRCHCKAVGNFQDTHQMALSFGLEHLQIMRTYVHEEKAKLLSSR